MRFRKVYLEISNICNLSCRFCPGTKRQKKAMTEEDETLKAGYIALIGLAKNILEPCINILGFSAPEKM